MSDPNKNADAAKPARPKKRFRIMLGVSLALNLLFVGAIVGAIATGGGKRGGPPDLRAVAAPYVAAFDLSTKRAMRKDMRAQLPTRKEAKAANKADYEAFLETVRTEPFDAVRAAAIMEKQFMRGAQFQSTGRKVAIERISNMSVEERKAYAERLQGWLEHRKKHGKRKER